MELQVQDRTAYAYTGGKAFDAALPCVVFVHGALNEHSEWTLPARWFAHHGHAVLAVDLPGHVRSAGPPLASVEAAADWLLALLAAAGVTRAALVGHSMGSLIALEAAARAAHHAQAEQTPHRITQLVMVATAYPMAVSQALLDTARDDPMRAIDQTLSYSFSTLAPKPSQPGPGAWLRGDSRAVMRRVQASQPGLNLFHHDFSVCNAYANGFEAAAQVRCPVTLLLGERDQMTLPKNAAAIGRALNARTVLLPTGHALMSEAPDALLQALREALQTPA